MGQGGMRERGRLRLHLACLLTGLTHLTLLHVQVREGQWDGGRGGRAKEGKPVRYLTMSILSFTVSRPHLLPLSYLLLSH